MATSYKAKRCPNCGTTFIPKDFNSVYCCKKCAQEAARKRAKEKRRLEYLKEIAKVIPDNQDYLSISEAVAVFAVEKYTLYYAIRHKKLAVIRTKRHGIRIRRKVLAQFYQTRTEAAKQAPLPARVKLWNLEPQNCYTIGEATEKFKVGSSCVYNNVRKYKTEESTTRRTCCNGPNQGLRHPRNAYNDLYIAEYIPFLIVCSPIPINHFNQRL